MEGDTAAWRARMLRDWALDRSAIEAWFRTGYTPASLEEWYMNSGIGKKNPSSQTQKEVGGRHFSRDNDTLMLDPGSTFTLEIYNVMASEDVAVVDLNVVVDGKSFIIQGSSKRAPGDKPDRELGTTLAVVRALQSLTRRIERQANGRIKQNDWIAAQRPLVAKAREERKNSVKEEARIHAPNPTSPFTTMDPAHVRLANDGTRWFIIERLADEDEDWNEMLTALEDGGLRIYATNAPD